MFRVSTLTLLLISLLLSARPAAAAGTYDLLKGCSLRGVRSALKLPPQKAPSVRKEIPTPQVEQTKSKDPVAAIPVGPTRKSAVPREQRMNAYGQGVGTVTDSPAAVPESIAPPETRSYSLSHLSPEFQAPETIAESEKLRGELALTELQGRAYGPSIVDKALLEEAHDNHPFPAGAQPNDAAAAVIEESPSPVFVVADLVTTKEGSSSDALGLLVDQIRKKLATLPIAEAADSRPVIRIVLEREPSVASALKLHELERDRPDLNIVTEIKGYQRARKVRPSGTDRRGSTTPETPDFHAEIQEKLDAVSELPALQGDLEVLKRNAAQLESYRSLFISTGEAKGFREEMAKIQAEIDAVKKDIGKILGDELEAQVANFFPDELKAMNKTIWKRSLHEPSQRLSEVDLAYDWAYVEVTRTRVAPADVKSKAEQLSVLLEARKSGILKRGRPVILYAPNYLQFADVKARLESEGYRQDVDFFFARSREELAAIREKLLRNPTSDRGLLTR